MDLDVNGDFVYVSGIKNNSNVVLTNYMQLQTITIKYKLDKLLEMWYNIYVEKKNAPPFFFSTYTRGGVHGKKLFWNNI